MSPEPSPRTGGWWPLLAVVAGVVVGLVIALAGRETWRLGCIVIAASLLMGAAERALLPARLAGLLQVRGRWVDVAALGLAGVALFALAIAVPEGRR